MTALPSSLSQTAVAPGAGVAPGLTLAEVEQSCRLPVSMLLSGAAAWLIVGAIGGVLAAIKAHAPGFLSAPGWLTYGRIRPFAANAFVYGFLIQASLAVGLWMICRLGRCRAQGGRMITAAAGFWNIGLLIGVVGILGGASTSYDWLELPRMATPILFCAFLLIATWLLITLHTRQVRELYVSQSLVLTALLWFPWVYSTAQLFLVFRPVRGVMQAVVNGWFTQNFFELCLAPWGLAVVFYLLPKLVGRPLYSRGLVLFGFWVLVFFGGWGGVRPGIPAPNWLSSVSVIARVFLLIPILAFGLSWWRTVGTPGSVRKTDWTLRFVFVAGASYVLAGVLQTLGVLPLLDRVTAFTLYDFGIVQLRLHGFLGMALAGAIYHAAPRVFQINWPTPGLVRLHFWCAVVGSALLTLALVVGGIVQGAALENGGTDFMSVLRATVPFLGTSTLGMTVLLVGYGAFVVHLGQLLVASCPCCAGWQTWGSARLAQWKGKA